MLHEKFCCGKLYDLFLHVTVEAGNMRKFQDIFYFLILMGLTGWSPKVVNDKIKQSSYFIDFVLIFKKQKF